MRLSIIAGTVLLAASSAAMANGLDFQLSNKTAQLTFLTDSGLLGYSGAQLSFGGFTNSNNDYMGEVGLLVQGIPAGRSPLTFGLGVNAYAAHIHQWQDNVQALAISGLAKYTIPNRMPMAVVLDAHYAPEITTFSSGKSFTDVGLNYQIEVTPGATAYAGYRLLQTNVKNHGEYNLDDGFHVGIRLAF
ncbi:hypothetical protein [Acidihalobacter ferrooxydans]|uniref:YfaZ n=1 Tax=Acidihalobacter ferrooxydans TaxID=1765967 RepID=A0A1P8UD93_9GAMM|nr:hypothetical protein [Acidihalobacter ferrooxydans]APZ41756.1 hypothetical protein BW247_00475 [Acidihalobacter ferrooxydans]